MDHCSTMELNSQSLGLLSINPFCCREWGWGDRNGIFVVTRSMKVTESHTKKEAQVVALFLGLKWGDWFQCLLAGN